MRVSMLYPRSLMSLLPPKSGRSITDRIKILLSLISKFSVNNSAQAIAVPPVATKSSTIAILSSFSIVVFV